MKNLKCLKLDENLLLSLPASIGGASGLEELHLAHNQLQSIPGSVGLLRKLHTLFLDDNVVEEIPPGTFGVSSLRRSSHRI
jgi:Leucine-rich repeat (LRR) protein